MLLFNNSKNEISLSSQLNYLKKACFALLVIGAVFLIFSSATSPNRPVQWEYRTISFSSNGFGLQRDLNNLGREGWEVVATAPADGDRFHVILKRRR